LHKIIDIHAHVGESAGLYVAGSIDAVTHRMKTAGITHSVISPIPGYEDPFGKASTLQMNDQMLEIKQNNPHKFPLAMGVVEPRHGKLVLEEVEYVLGTLQLDGLMFHNDFNGIEMHSPRMQDIMEEARHYKNCKMIMLHTAQHSMLEPPFALWILAEKFPDITFICGHPMMTMIQLDNVAAVAKHCPNILIDTCYLWNHNNQIDRAVDLMGGADRFIFGTDNPYFSDRLCIDRILIERAKFSEKEKEMIFSGNFERIFGAVEAVE
jgi:predicted TIM-barrel fold metal-dependent hydrolase